MDTHTRRALRALLHAATTATLVVAPVACSYRGAEADRQSAQEQPATHAPEEPTTAAAEPAQTPSPTVAPTVPAIPVVTTPALAPSDGGGASDSGGAISLAVPSDAGGEVKSAPPTSPSFSLVPESPTSVTYLRAVQDFSPGLEVWSVDGDELHYVAYNCVGGRTEEAYAGLVENADLTTTARWDGDAPGELTGYSMETESDLTIDERTLRPVLGGSDTIASTRYELELQDFSRMCLDAGNSVAAFVY